MYNIQKAVSRLPFAPKTKEIEVTDIKRGVAVFAPKAAEPVSFAALKEALKRAGYTLASAEISVAGTLRRDSSGWSLVADQSAQVFTLDAGALKPNELADGAGVEVSGNWTTDGTGRDARETIAAVSIAPKGKAARDTMRLRGNLFKIVPASHTPDEEPPPVVDEEEARSPARDWSPSAREREAAAFSPVRTTSPGLTVYRGGAFVPRFTYTRQRLGSLEVRRQGLSVGVSYTPTPRLQVETEAAVSRTTYADGGSGGAGWGFGNLSVSGKYRFYRSVGEWGDRQAAARFGLELPTGSDDAPSAEQLPGVSAYVRQQLSPISGGLAARGDLSYSQARGRMIFGGNVEGVLRASRGGFRTGHELRANTDLEFVVFPFDYRRPTGEVFAILETNFVWRGAGRVEGREVAGSGATEFYLAPALQYVATPRVVFEASAQLPVARRAGAESLRTSASVLLGVRYLF